MLTHLFEPSFFVKIYRCLPIVNLSLCCICQKNVKKTSKVISNNHHTQHAPLSCLLVVWTHVSPSNLIYQVVYQMSTSCQEFARTIHTVQMHFQDVPNQDFWNIHFWETHFRVFFCVWNMKKEIEMFRLVFNLKEKRTGDPNLDRHL